MNMHTKIIAATATLSQLKPGQEYPDGNINARLHCTDAEIEELAASLKGPDGQLRPFLVASHPKKTGTYFVFGGGRRRLAYERLIFRGDLPKDHPIEIKDFGHITVDEALSKSLADNQAVPMHPADQAATFARLVADRSPEEIAKARGMTLRAVQQAIALGASLIPEVLQRWRSGKLSREAVEVLTVADQDQQRAILKDSDEGAYDLSNSHDLGHVREIIQSNKGAETARLLGFVTVGEARAAGIEVTEDFFGQGGAVKDLKALQKLAGKKMKALVEAELAAGWSWADGKLSASRGMHHGYGECKVKPEYKTDEKARLTIIEDRLTAISEMDMPSAADDREETVLTIEKERIKIEAEARAYTPKQKASAGVIIHLNEDGSPDFNRGLIRKSEAAKKKQRLGGPANYAQREPEPLDYRARNALCDWQNEALKGLVVKRPHDCVAAILTGAMYSGSDGPVRSDLDKETGGTRDFAGAFTRNRKLTDTKLVEALAAFFRPDIADWQGKPKKSAEPLIQLVGVKEYQAALVKAFEPKVYFGGASKKHMLGVMAEAFGPAARKNAEDKGDEALRSIFIKEIGKTGWLPPELRTSAYAGPTAKAPAKAEKPAAKKKAA